MKKYVLTLVVLLVAVVTLTGCGSSKSLTCSNDEETVTLDFDGDEITKVSMKMFMDEAESEEAAKEAKKEAEEEIKKTQMDGVTFGVSVDGKKIYMEVKFDVNKVDETTKNTFLAGLVDKGLTREDIKKDAEENGFTCK